MLEKGFLEPQARSECFYLQIGFRSAAFQETASPGFDRPGLLFSACSGETGSNGSWFILLNVFSFPVNTSYDKPFMARDDGGKTPEWKTFLFLEELLSSSETKSRRI